MCSAWYLVLYFLVVINVALVVLLCISSYDQILAVKVTQVIFQILWIPIAFVLQVRSSNLYQMVSERGGGIDVIRHQSRDHETIPDWLKQAMMVALIDGTSSGSMRWLVVFGACKLFSKTIKDFLGGRKPSGERDSGETPAWMAESVSVQRLRTAVSVLSMAVVCAYFQSPIQISLSLTYCMVTDTTAFPLVLEAMKQLGHDVDILDGVEEYIAHALYLACEVVISLIYMIAGSLSMNPVVLPCIYFNLIIPALKMYQDVWLKVREENENLRDFPVASREELRDHGDVCPICLTKLTSGRQTPCGHFFHSRCLRLSQREMSKCPMCKRPLKRSTKTTNE